jgi:hypothetical protein
MNQRSVNGRTFAMAQELLDLVAPCIREEERRDAFEAFYAVCKKHLEQFCIEQDRMMQRLKPTSN